MCRNIRPLYNFEPPATHDEVHDAALQFVRKVSGFTKPAKANEEAFELAVAGDLGRDDAPARRARDQRAAQGPRGRGGQAPRPLGRALRRVAARSQPGRGPAGIRRGPRGSLPVMDAFTGERGWAASRRSPRRRCSPARRSPPRPPATTARSRASTATSGARPRRATTCASRPRSARRRRSDNALAPSRASATPGTFGPDLCAPGYVWREAVPGDHVCVTPATWQQVHDDNLTAGARRNALQGEGRTTDAATADLLGARRRHQRRGRARRAVLARRRRGPRCRGPSSRAAARRAPAASSRSTRGCPCARRHPNAIVRVRDPSSLRWSSSRRIATGCASP